MTILYPKIIRESPGELDSIIMKFKDVYNVDPVQKTTIGKVTNGSDGKMISISR